jgi:hypothetical protein
MVVSSCWVTDPSGWPPSGAHEPPLGDVVNFMVFTPLADVHAVDGGSTVAARLELQFGFPHPVTFPASLQSTPTGSPHVHGAQLRESPMLPK